MSNISIFAKRAFLSTNRWSDFDTKETMYKGNGHLMRVSSIIRADQIATYLGAKLNPESDYENDVCVYVKPHAKAFEDFKFEGVRSYLDIIDGWGLIPLLEKHPEIPVIGCSRQDCIILSKRVSNPVWFIPQHHCNYERAKRTREGVKTVGIIGTKDAFDYIPVEIREGLAKRGIELLEYSKFFSREDIVNFYKQIDVQLVWRPYRMRLSNPLKLVNAASFGIPTIARREGVFDAELGGYYIAVDNPDQFFEALDSLREDPIIYTQYSDLAHSQAERYHIENVAKEYQRL